MIPLYRASSMAPDIHPGTATIRDPIVADDGLSPVFDTNPRHGAPDSDGGGQRPREEKGERDGASHRQGTGYRTMVFSSAVPPAYSLK
jgi:hypothetical protein